MAYGKITFIDDTIFPTIPSSMNTIAEVLPIPDAPDVDDDIIPAPSKPLNLSPVMTWYYDENEIEFFHDTTTAYQDDATIIKNILPESFQLGNGMNYNEVTVFIITDLDVSAPGTQGSLFPQMSFKTGQATGCYASDKFVDTGIC